MHPQGVNVRDAIASGTLAGPRLRVAGPTLTSPGGHPVSTIYEGRQRLIESAARQLAEPDSARRVVNRLVDEGVDLGEDADSLLREMAAREMVQVPTLAVMDSFFSEQRMDSVLNQFSRWLEHDIPIALGTDAGNIPAGESVYQEMRLYVEAGMSPYQALQTATINTARHGELSGELGTLESGKTADIVIFRQNPLERIRNLSPPAMVFRKGNRMFDE